MVQRQVEQTDLQQGEQEQLVYALTTTPWGDNPTEVTVKAYDESAALANVSSTVLSGDSSVTGNVITLPTVKSLTEDHNYRIEILFTTDDDQIWETFFELAGTK